VDREKFLQTQNSGVMSEVTHNGKDIDFCGVLKDDIELQYPSNYEVRRTVVLFRCDWYNQVGKTVGLRDDKYFKSINVQSFWYKTDHFILADQAKKIFYLQDTTPQCKDWRVVQKFQHRNIDDVSKTDEGRHDVHHDEYCSDTEHVVQEGDDNEVLQNVEGFSEMFIHHNIVSNTKNYKIFQKNNANRYRKIKIVNITKLGKTTKLLPVGFDPRSYAPKSQASLLGYSSGFNK